MASELGRCGLPDRERGVEQVELTAPWQAVKDAAAVGAEVQVCANGANTLVTSRNPDDLPAFCEQLVAAFASSPCDLITAFPGCARHRRTA